MKLQAVVHSKRGWEMEMLGPLLGAKFLFIYIYIYKKQTHTKEKSKTIYRYVSQTGGPQGNNVIQYHKAEILDVIYS